MFKKHNWMNYGYGGSDEIRIQIFDSSNKMVDHFKTNSKKEFKEISKIIAIKYGFEASPSEKKDELKELKKEKEEDKEWLGKDIEW